MAKLGSTRSSRGGAHDPAGVQAAGDLRPSRQPPRARRSVNHPRPRTVCFPGISCLRRAKTARLESWCPGSSPGLATDRRDSAAVLWSTARFAGAPKSAPENRPEPLTSFRATNGECEEQSQIRCKCLRTAERRSAPDRIRTCDLRFRRPVLNTYKSELRTRLRSGGEPGVRAWYDSHRRIRVVSISTSRTDRPRSRGWEASRAARLLAVQAARPTDCQSHDAGEAAPRVRVRIHRGAHEIGGSCAEVEHERSRVVLDIGLPLDAGSMMSCGYRRLRDWAAAIRR